MFISLATAFLAAAGIATAGPIEKRAGVNDGKKLEIESQLAAFVQAAN